jgi:hypothetical protein
MWLIVLPLDDPTLTTSRLPRDKNNRLKYIVVIILIIITLASSNNTLPDDGDCTETCRSCFNVNFNLLLKQLPCASVGK